MNNQSLKRCFNICYIDYEGKSDIKNMIIKNLSYTIYYECESVDSPLYNNYINEALDTILPNNMFINIRGYKESELIAEALYKCNIRYMTIDSILNLFNFGKYLMDLLTEYLSAEYLIYSSRIIGFTLVDNNKSYEYKKNNSF